LFIIVIDHNLETMNKICQERRKYFNKWTRSVRHFTAIKEN